MAAIGWEIWRKNRSAIIGAVVFMLLWAVTNYFLAGIETAAGISGQDRNAVSLMFLSWLVAACLFIFSYTENDRKKGFAGPPTRMFALPVPTHVLVTLPMVTGVLAMELVYLFFSRVILQPSGCAMPDGRAMLAIPAAVASFQAILWGGGSFPRLRAFALAAWIFGLGFTIAWVAEPNEVPLNFSLAAQLLLPVLAFGSFVFALVAVRQERCGGFNPEIFRWIASRVPDLAGRRRKKFASPAAAQFWLEWRGNGLTHAVLLLAAAIWVMVSFLILSWTEGNHDVEPWLAFSIIVTVSFCILWVPIVGILLARDPSARSLAGSQFLVTRPLTTGALFISKFKLAVLMGVWWLLLTSGLAWLIRIVFGQIAGAPSGGLDGLRVLLVAAMAMIWLMAGALPAWLWGRIHSVPWAGLLLLGAGIGILQLGDFLRIHFPDATQLCLPWLMGAALVIKISVAIWAFRRSVARKLIGRKFVIGYFIFWAVATIGWMWAGNGLFVESQLAGPMLLPFFALLFPLARIALSPLALDAARHR